MMHITLVGTLTGGLMVGVSFAMVGLMYFCTEGEEILDAFLDAFFGRDEK